MNDCMNAEIRDALPDLLHGRLSDLDRSTMNAHVESCADCRSELALLERVRANAPLGPSIDVSRIVSMLPAPVVVVDQTITPAALRRQRSSMSLVWKLAAAATLVVAGTLTFFNAKKSGSPSSSVATIAPVQSAAPGVAVSAAAPSSSPTQVAIATPVAAAHVNRVAGSGLSLTGGVQDLTDAQLEGLLKDVDSVEGLPTVEPEAISVSVDGGEGLQ